MTSPVSETQGVQGMSEFLYLEKYAVNHHLGKIISQSWGTAENTLFTPGGRQILDRFNAFYRQATTKEDVTFFASSGDSGASNVDINDNTYPFPTVGFPASSPYVTAVGGTSLYASTSGKYQSETVWDEVTRNGGASGGGISQYFKEPGYQKSKLPSSDQKLLNGYRGIPDIAYNADPFTSILVYISFIPGRVGYYAIGGTSEGSPQWAGIAADINQLAGHPLGFLNPALYSIGNSNDYSESFHDTTVGNNTYSGVQGYDATPGWDASTGWGSPKVAVLADELLQRI
jgi:subtilase family serine protease